MNEIITGIIAVIIVISIGFIVMENFKTEVENYCQELINNNTIPNKGNCTVEVIHARFRVEESA